MTFVDDVGRLVDLPRPPRRIVSLVPSLTEVICALGVGDRLVGVTRFCTEPAMMLRGVVRLGGTKTPDLDRLRALGPDLVVLNSEENRRADFDVLEAASIPTYVSVPKTVRGSADSVERLAAAVGADGEGRRLAESMRAAVADQPADFVRVFCPIWRDPWMSFNRHTFCGDVLACAGGENVCASAAQRYPEVSLAQVRAAAPEVILLPSEPYRFGTRHLRALAPLHETPAWETGRVHLVDGKALSWYGPRTPDALAHLRALLRRN